MEKKRISYFDYAKGIGVILVLLGHLQGDIIFSYSPYILKLCTWIFSFHMPLFFIISGMLINVKRDIDKDFSITVSKRFKSIMIPYLWFSLIYICIVIYTLIFRNVITIKTLYLQIWYVLGMYGMNVLWFLPTLFAAELIFIYLTQHFKNKNSIFIIMLTVILAIACNFGLKSLPNNIALYERLHELGDTLLRPIFASSFILIGYYLYDGLNKLEAHLNKPLIVESIISLCALVINIYICFINQPVDFRSLVMNNYFLYYICSTAGSIFLILFCKILSSIKIGSDYNEDKHFRLIKFFGRNSLIFMAVHNNSAVLTLALTVAMYANQYLTRARGYICYAIVVTILMLYVFITTLIINKFFPFLTGKPFKRTNP